MEMPGRRVLLSILSVALLVGSADWRWATAEDNRGHDITPSPTGAVEATPPPGVYTYEEAVALGIEVGPTPEEIGLPSCVVDPSYGGVMKDDVVPLDEEAACAVDPHDVLFGVGLPVPHAGSGGDNGAYHWMGYRTNNEYAGGYVEVEAQNPEVDHVPLGQDDEFVASRVLTQVTTSSNWLEAGWIEASWLSDVRRVYTFRYRRD